MPGIGHSARVTNNKGHKKGWIFQFCASLCPYFLPICTKKRIPCVVLRCKYSSLFLNPKYPAKDFPGSWLFLSFRGQLSPGADSAGNSGACGLRLPEYGEFLVPLAAHRIVIISPYGCPEHFAQPPAVPVRAGEFAEQARQGFVRHRRQGEYLLMNRPSIPASHSGPGTSAPRYSTAAAVIRSANLSMR